MPARPSSAVADAQSSNCISVTPTSPADDAVARLTPAERAASACAPSCKHTAYKPSSSLNQACGGAIRTASKPVSLQRQKNSKANDSLITQSNYRKATTEHEAPCIGGRVHKSRLFGNR